MDNIIVFGTGSVAEEIYAMLDYSKVTVEAYINTVSHNETFHGKKIIPLSELDYYEYDYILIASGYVDTITELLKKNNVPEKKIVSFVFDDGDTYSLIKKELNNRIDQNFNRNILRGWIKEQNDVPDFYPVVMWDNTVQLEFYYKDFVREQTLNLISRILENNHTDGAVAELGVYKGDFTVIIDRIFRTEKLYLFDTFEGFSTNDIKDDDTIKNKTGESMKFKDTSTDFVLSRLSNRKRAIIKKGPFPDTFDNGIKKEKFMFISIDLNLEKPVYEALRLFYPIMVRGGYIMISDYSAPFYKGTRKAVDRWCAENDHSVIPMADFYGSALIVKE